MTYNFYYATPETDFDKLTEFVAGATSSNEMYPGIPLDASYLKDYLIDVAADGRIFIVESNNNIVGTLVAAINQSSPLFNMEKVALELLWYVNPNHRGVGKQLVELYEQWAKDSGATFACMAHLSNTHADKLAKFYESRGYKQTEVSYMKRID